MLNGIAEALRGEIQIVAEGVLANREATERLHEYIDARFKASDAAWRVAFADVRRDIVKLRGR